MRTNLFTKIAFAVLLAFTVNSVVYFGFGNIYSSKILNVQHFQEQFQSGVYQYRILSAYLLVWIYESISSLSLDFQLIKLKFFADDSDPKLYLSLYVLNTFFLCLSATLLMLISDIRDFMATPSEKILVVATAIFSIAITQFVIVPYDISSYFFLLLFAWIFLKYDRNESGFLLGLLVVILIVSTANRESAAISVAFAATLLWRKFGWQQKSILPVALLGFTFLGTYLGMRFFADTFATNDGNLLVENLSQPKNFLGILFWGVFFSLSVLISKSRQNRQNILVFHLLSLPYILMCFYSGILYEARLYIPLFLSALMLAFLHYPPSEKSTLIPD